MKILLFGPAYPLRGGVVQLIALLYEHLNRRGHDVEVINFKRQYPNFLFPGKTQKEFSEEPFRVPNKALIDTINPVNWIHYGLSLRQRHADLVMSTYWMPFFAPSTGTLHGLLRSPKTKTLTLMHNVIPHERMPGDMLLTKYLCRNTDYFLVMSKKVEADLRSVIHDPVYKFVPHPIYESFGERVDKAEAKKFLSLTDEKIILFFGYIRAYKGLDILLRAVAKVLAHQKVRLLVAGEFYGDEEKYRNLIDELHLKDSVTVVSDFIPNEKVKYYFSASDCAVLPYRSATQSGIIQTAYQFSVPVIASRIGGIPEVVHDGISGLLVEPDNVDALADSILHFYSGNVQAIVEAGVAEERKKYSWENLVNAIEELTNKQ
jgi:glycosyltransferase involved in cell wall biosynthesis